MSFIKPMLAVGAEQGKLPKGNWIAEEKFDGHRMGIRVAAVPGQVTSQVTAWSRLGNVRALPKHLLDHLTLLPVGYYDGELTVPAGYSSSVTDLSNTKHLELVLFDLLEFHGESLCSKPLSARRIMLENTLYVLGMNTVVRVAKQYPISTWEDAAELVGMMWDEGKEGIVLKDLAAKYEPGKRRKSFLKVKELHDKGLTIRGFCPSEGEVMNLGDFGTVVLQDERDIFTAVKVLDAVERAKLEKIWKEDHGGEHTWAECRLPAGTKLRYFTDHRYVVEERVLNIEYQMQTPDGSYRHPHWNYLED